MLPVLDGANDVAELVIDDTEPLEITSELVRNPPKLLQLLDLVRNLVFLGFSSGRSSLALL